MDLRHRQKTDSQLCVCELMLRQGAMDKMYGNGSFSDSRGDAFHIPCANITHGKHAGKARFQHLWRTGQCPQRGSGGGIQITPREDEPFVIESNAAAQPLGSRGCSRHDEYVANRVDRSLAVQLILPSDALKMRATVERSDFRFEMQFDAWILFDSPDQVARHAVRQRTGAYQHVHLARCLREENRRLSGGVSPAHDDNFFLFAQLRLHLGRAVVDSLSLKL